MKERARRARRILRDHRRAPNLYSHTRYLGPFNVNWTCPRCAGRRALGFDRPLVSGQWRLEALVSGQRRLEARADEAVRSNPITEVTISAADAAAWLQRGEETGRPRRNPGRWAVPLCRCGNGNYVAPHSFPGCAEEPEPSRGSCVSCPRADDINAPCPCDDEE